MIVCSGVRWQLQVCVASCKREEYPLNFNLGPLHIYITCFACLYIMSCQDDDDTTDDVHKMCSQSIIFLI